MPSSLVPAAEAFHFKKIREYRMFINIYVCICIVLILFFFMFFIPSSMSFKHIIDYLIILI